MTTNAWDIGQKLYTVTRSGYIEVDEEMRERVGIDTVLYGPVVKEDEVRSVTLKNSETHAHDGTVTRKEERWHRLLSGQQIGPTTSLVFITLQEAVDRAIICLEEEIEFARNELVHAQAKLVLYETMLSRAREGIVPISRPDHDN